MYGDDDSEYEDEYYGELEPDDQGEGEAGEAEQEAEYPDDWYALMDDGYEVYDIDVSISYGDDT